MSEEYDKSLNDLKETVLRIEKNAINRNFSTEGFDPEASRGRTDSKSVNDILNAICRTTGEDHED